MAERATLPFLPVGRGDQERQAPRAVPEIQVQGVHADIQRQDTHHLRGLEAATAGVVLCGLDAAERRDDNGALQEAGDELRHDPQDGQEAQEGGVLAPDERSARRVCGYDLREPRYPRCHAAACSARQTLKCRV